MTVQIVASLQNTVVSRLRNSIKSGNKQDRDAYRFLKGSLDNIHEQPVSNDRAVKIFRDLLKEAKANPHSFSDREVEILTELVPPFLDEKATEQYLRDKGVFEQIKGCPREGQAIGIAMKTCAQGNRCVNSDIVRQIVLALRKTD